MTECCSPPPPLPCRHTHRHTTAKHSLRSAKTKGPNSRGGVLTNAHIRSSLMVQKQRDMGSAGDGGDRLDPQVGKIPRRRKCDLLQNSRLKDPMNRGAWWATVHEAAKESDATDRLSTQGTYTWLHRPLLRCT